MNRKALLPVFVSLGVFVVLFAAVALYLSYANNQKVDAVQSTAAVTSVTGISELKVTSADIPVSRQVVGGDLKVTGNVTIVDGLSSSSLRLTPVANTSTVQAGQLYSAADNSLYYYDGRTTTNITSINGVRSDVAQLRVDTARLLSKPEGVVTLQGQQGNVQFTGTDGIVINGTTISNNGVLTVQGRAGNVQFTGGDGVAVDGTSITNTGVTSIGAQTGALTLGTGLTVNNGTLSSTGITQLFSGSADITVTPTSGGSYTIGYAGSGTSGTVALSPTTPQQDAGSNAAIWVNKTGLGNLLQLSTGTSAANKFVVDQSGAIVSGSIDFSQVTGIPSMVNSIGGLTGTIPVGSGLAINGGQLVATTAVSNLVGTANQVNVTGTGSLTLSLPQDIATTSTPTFAGINVASAITIANGGTGATTAGGARTNLSAAKSGANADITALSGLTTAVSVSQGGTGTTSLTQNGVVVGNGIAGLSTINASGANQCLLSDGAGVLSFQSCPGAGGVASVNGKSGAVTVTAIDPASIDSSGASVIIKDASYTTKGLASFSSANFSVINGAVNTVQNISSTSAPSFSGLNLTNALGVTSGGTGSKTFATNGLLLGQGTAAVTTVGTATAGQCLVSGTGGALSFASCPGASGVSSVNGMNGAVSLSTMTASSLSQVAGTITIKDATDTVKGLAAFNADNLIVSNGIVNTVQNINTAATPTFAGLNLGAALSVANGGTGRSSLAANNIIIGNGTGAVSTIGTTIAGQCLASGTGGVLSFVTCPGADVVNSVNGTATGAVTLTAVDPASIDTTGNVVTIKDASYTTKGLASFNGGNFSVANGVVNTVQDIKTTAMPTFGGLTLTGALGVTSGGTGASSFAANSILIGQGTSAVSSLGTATAGQCLVSGTGGYLSFASCPGASSVASVNGLVGAVTVTGVDGTSVLASGNTVTIKNATDTIKGLAAFNSDNLIVTNGVVDTIQDISSSATPTFANLALTTALGVSDGGTGATSLALHGVVIGNGAAALSTVTSSGANQCLISAADGTVSFASCPGTGGVSSLNGLTGAVNLNAADPNSIAVSGSTVTIRDATATRKGLASFDASNFTVTNGAVNLVQDIGTGATPTFASLSLTNALTVANGGTGAITAAGARVSLGAAASGANSDITSLGSISSIASTAGLTVGSAGKSLTLQGSTTTLTQVSGASSTQLAFDTPTANVIYKLQAAAAGTYDVCTTAGNCVGTGGSVTTPGGTIGKLSKYISGSAIGDSIITDNGSTVSIGGTLSVNNITPTAAAIIGATTQSLTLQGSTTSIKSTSGASTNTLTFNTPAGANKTIVIPNASGTVAISAAGPLVLDANGNLTCPDCLTTSGSGGNSGVSNVNGSSGALTLTASDANSIVTLGSTITVQDASTSLKGLASFNSANFTVTNGVVNTIQDISATASPTFAGLTLSAPLSVSSGGTGKATFATGSLLIGNGSGGITTLAPVGASQCLASDTNSNLVFVPCPGTSVVNYVNGINGTITIDTATSSSLLTTGNNIRIQDATSAIKGLAAFNSANLTVTNGVVNTVQDISATASPTFAGLSLTTALGIAQGGTGATTAAAARTNIAAAKSGANSDITSLTGLTTALSVAQGGTGATALAANRVLLGNGTATVAVSNAAAVGQCLVGNVSGAPTFQACPGAGGVSDVNGLTGAVTLDTVTASSLNTTGNNIRIQDATAAIKGLASFDASNFTVTNGVVNTVQNISTAATPTFAGLNLSSALSVPNGGTGRTTLATNGVLIGQGVGGVSTVGTATANQCLVSGTGGVLSFASCPGAGGVSSVNGLTSAVTIDTATPSSLLTTGNNIRIQDATSAIKGLASFNSANLTVTNGVVNTVQNIGTTASPTFAALTLTAPLSVANGGTGQSSLAANSLVIGNGSSAVSTLGTSAAGKCLVTGAGGALSFLDCPGTDVVNNINGTATGAVTITAVDPASIDTTANVITIKNASYTTKGLASFNGGNFTVTNGAVNTIQGIATTDAPTFAGLALTTALGVSSGGTGTTTLATNGVLVGQGAGAVSTVSTATANQCLVSGTGGVLSFASCPGAGGVSAFNGLTGAVTVNTVTSTSLLTSGNTVTIKDASDTIKGLASFNSANLTVTGGSVNTIQNIATTASPTFAGLTLASALSVANGGTGTSSLTANRVLLGNGTSGVAVSNAATSGYCLIGNVSGAPTFQACPVGGDISSGTSQTAGKVAIFDTVANHITDSVISQAGTAVTVGGQLTATSFLGNGSALTSLTAGNLTGTVADARLSSNVTIQGNTFNGGGQLVKLDTTGSAGTTNGLCLMSTASGLGAAFQTCPGSGIVAGANTSLSNLANVAINDMLLPGVNNSIDLGSAAKGFKNLYLAGTITAAGSINGLSLASTSLQSASSLSLSAGGTNQNITVASSGSGNVVLNKGTGNLVLSGLDCTVVANGGKLTTSATGVVSCADDVSGVGAIGALDGQTKSANGAVVSGNTLYLQSADASNPGLVTTGAQTLAGNKTFTGTVASPTVTGVTNAGTNVVGGTLNIQGGNGTGSGGSGDIVLSTAGAGAAATVSSVTADGSQYKSANGNTGSFSVTVPAGVNRVLVLSLMTASTGANATSVTYGGVAMTQVAAVDGANNVGRADLWYLVNPTVGTATATANFSGYRNTLMRAVTLTGVNQTTPFGTPCTASGNSSTSASCVVTTVSGDLVIDMSVASNPYTAIGSGETSLYANDLQAQYASMSSKLATGTSTTQSYTYSGVSNSALVAVAVKSANAVGSTTPDAMTDRLRVTATGNVGINNSNPQYTLDVSGTLNASGNLTVTGNATITGVIAANNSALFKNATNSTTAFAVQNATGTALFNVDTTNSKIGIGAVPTSAGATLQIAGNVSAQTGFQSYNSTSASYVTVLTGNAGAPTLQNVTIATGSNLVGSAAMGVVYTDTTGALQKLATSGASVGNCLAYTATNTLGFQSCTSTATGYVQGGNAFGTAGNLGVTDNQALNILQNGAGRINLDVLGNVTLTPAVNKFVFVNASTADSDAALIVGGGIKATGFKVGTLNGVNLTSCTGYIQNMAVSGGIVTAGSCSVGGSAGQALVQGGNAFNATMTLGTTDNNGINLIQNNTTRIAVSQSGDIDFTSGVSRFVRVNTSDTDGQAAFTVGGRIKSTAGFRVGTTNGIDLTCGNGNQTLGAVTLMGGIVTQASCATNNSDLAENYNSNDNVQAGELVMASNDGATSVNRATAAKSGALMGIVSTNPGKVLGTEQVPNGYPIALSGRVPTKVNNEGGAIAVGDKITISSVAGVGKKATGAGMVVGTAVESFDGAGTGAIEVFVNLMYFNPVDGNNLQAQTGTFNDLNITGSATIASLTVTDQAHFKGNIVIDGHIITGGNAPNYAVGAANSGGTAVMSGNDTAGTVTITTGASATPGELMNLVFSKQYGKTPRIIMSGQDDASLRSFIFPSAKTATGFSLSTAQTLAPNTTYTFDYFIVE